MGLCSLCGRAIRFVLLRPASLLLACLCLAFWSYLGSPGTRVRTLVSAGSGTAGRGAARFLGGGELMAGARAGGAGAPGGMSEAGDDLDGPGGYMAQAGRAGMAPGGGPEFVEVAKWNSKTAAAFALRGLGRRAAGAGGDRAPSDPKMRALEDWENRTHPGIFGIFDGHGGEFAADFALKRLTQGLRRRLLDERPRSAPPAVPQAPPRAPPPPPPLWSTPSSAPGRDARAAVAAGAAAAVAAAPSSKGGTAPVAMAAAGTSAGLGADGERPRARPREVAAGRVRELALEEVLATETELLAHQAASQDESGTSLLLAVLGERGLTVVSVGDSQAVLCDGAGPARPLTRPHKPYLQAERRRIKQAGGYISFSERAWRVQGVLTASRSLGDPGLKAARIVIADPDVVTRETNPDPAESATGAAAAASEARGGGGGGGVRFAGSAGLLGETGGFLLLGSNELWSGVSADEACALVSERLLEPGMGARELALRAFHRRGGPDGAVAVMVVKPPARAR